MPDPDAGDDTVRHTNAAEPLGGADTLHPGDAGELRRTNDDIPEDLELGRFTLIRQLGRGGMGVVYTAYDNLLDRVVAIKMVRRDRADIDLFARVLREAKALAKLSHPNVVPIFDVGKVTGTDDVFIAMEYVEGPTLRAWIERRRADGAGVHELLDVLIQAGRGLAAAHAAGFVHRDFKPDNVLVGADGRARVLDFGLVTRRPAEQTELVGSVLSSIDWNVSPDVPLTSAGTILGTPAYMSPEQWLGRQADARSDQFSFCACVYEALYGVRPFAGGDANEVLAAMKRGEFQADDPGRVPAPIAAALRRGLAFRARDRFPDLDALLAALADDPAAGRQQRWRKIGLGAAAVAGAWLVGVGGLWGWERWQQQRAEQRASERLAAAMQRFDELVAEGEAAEAERLFSTFVAHSDNRGTAALGRAWLLKAERERRRGEVAPAIDALAAAYTVSTWPEDQAEALRGLSTVFREQLRWPSLLLALATAERRGIEEGEAGAALELDAELGRRDLRGAVARLRGPMKGSEAAAAVPVLAALSAATETRHRHHGYAIVADLDGDGRPELVFETNARDRQLVPIVRADMRLDPIATVDLGKGTFRALSPAPDRPGLLISTDRAGESAAVVSRLDGDRLVEVFRWPDEQIRAALAADVDGDGARELLVGTGPYTRRLVELVHGTDDAWSTRAPAPAVDRRRSDIVDLLADDFDGDGRVEVVVALGPWNAYELHVLRHDPASDTLRTVTRRRLGNIAGAARVAGPEIVVSKTDEYPSSVVFPRDRRYGAPAGTYLFRLVGGSLVESGFAPAPRLAAGERVIDGPPIVGDFDGDGRDEIVVCREVGRDDSSGERDNTVILVRGETGALTPVVLGGMRPIAALDLDGDRDDELLVSVSDDGDRDRVWVLGSGTAMLPPLLPATPRAAPLASPDPVLDRMLQRADDLAQMGLAGQSADNLAMIAGLVGDPELRARVELRAAELHEANVADAQAAELFARAARVLGPAASEGAARTSLRLGRIDAAAAHLEAASQGPGAPELRAAIAALRGSGALLEFQGPLAPSWRIGQALALRRDGARATLHVDALVAGELVSAPVRWSGESLALEVDVELARVEWNAGLEIGLLREGAGLSDGTSPLGIDITTTGGGNDRTHEIGCVNQGRRAVARIPFAIGEPGERLGRFTIRATYLPELGELTCEVVRGSGEVLLYRRGPLVVEPSHAPLRLTIAASRAPRAWVEAEIRRVRLLGAGLDVAAGEPDEPALVEARRRLVEDDALGALASLQRATAPTPADRLLAVVATARLGRWGEAERALALLLADAGAAAAVAAPLDALLRTAPELFGVLLRGAGDPGAARARLASAWYRQVVFERSPRAFAVGWAGLAERDLDADDHDVLRVHAHSAAALGHHEAAEASFRAALRAVDDPRRSAGSEGPAWVETERAAIRLELAALALARGDEEAARDELRPFTSGPDVDPYIVERLRAREDLRALWDLAPG